MHLGARARGAGGRREGDRARAEREQRGPTEAHRGGDGGRSTAKRAVESRATERALGLGNPQVAGTAGAGNISSSNLESSTVDLSTQFTGLITTQRAYQASSKIITTADQMLQSLLQVIQ